MGENSQMPLLAKIQQCTTFLKLDFKKLEFDKELKFLKLEFHKNGR